MNSALSIGIAISIASAFGFTTKSIGSTDIMRRPSSCSLVTIDAISAAIADPARPGDEQRREHRPELAHERETHHRAERALGAEPRQRHIALEAEHRADRRTRQAHDRERQHADVVDLVHEPLHAPRRPHGVAADLRHERREAPEVRDQRDGAQPEVLDRIHAPSPFAASASSSAAKKPATRASE
jgi:hypothetical protein